MAAGADSCGERVVLPGAEARDAEEEVFRQLNNIRRKNGLKEFSRGDTLNESARRHSSEMSCRGSLFHQDPDFAVRDLQERGEAGARCAWAENVGMVPVGNVKGIGFVDSPAGAGKALVWLWMESPGHRRNIMNARLRNVGVGVVRDRSGSYYGTAIFLGP